MKTTIGLSVFLRNYIPHVFLLLILPSLASCYYDYPQKYSQAEAEKIFLAYNADFQMVASYIEEECGAEYNYASIENEATGFDVQFSIDGTPAKEKVLKRDVLGGAMRRVFGVGKSGTMIFRTDSLLYFQLAASKVHAVQRASGIVKVLKGEEPRMDLIWVEDWKTFQLSGDWYYFSY